MADEQTQAQIPEKVQRFRRFIEYHAHAFADAAERGFRAHGRGVVVFEVSRLEGGAEFRPQPVGITLQYLNREQVVAAQPRPPMMEMLDAYQPPDEAVIVATYPDGSYDVTRVSIRALAQRATGPQARFVPETLPGPGGPAGGGPGPQSP